MITVELAEDEAAVIQYGLSEIFGDRAHEHLPAERPDAASVPSSDEAKAVHDKIAASLASQA